MQSQLSPKLTDFLFAHIDSVHTLDVLLLLWEAPERIWKSADVHDRIKSSLAAVKSSLHILVISGLVKQASPDEFCYSPSSAELAVNTTELLKNYSERSAAVIEIIYSKPTRGARDHADAPNREKEAEGA
jgi:hypothetical protein